MTDDEVLVGLLLEDAWLSLEQVAGACAVDTAWLLARLQADLFPEAACAAGTWRFPPAALARARRMRQVERDFDAAPELAALVADLLEEIDRLRAHLSGPPR